MREDAKSLGKLQGGLNMPCVKFGNPPPKLEGLQNVESTEFMSKKMSLDESGRRQNSI